jgi:hypothetical protein
MTNKTISINPSLFNVGALTKTKKNRDKSNKSNNVPLISPNKLKDRILKRIKEHKMKETTDLHNDKDKKSEKNELQTEKETNIEKYTDEFNDSIQYLQSLSDDSKRENDQNNFAKKVERRRQDLQRKTLKSYTTPQNMPEVMLELPDELKEPFIPNSLTYQTPQIVSRQPIIHDTVPYGILKGGNKPTYRQWSRTHKNPPIKIDTNPSPQPQQLSHVQNTSSREQKLQMLKRKMIENKDNHNKVNHLSETYNHTPVLNPDLNPITNTSQQLATAAASYIINNNINNDNDNDTNTINGGSGDAIQSTPYKKIIKRTIRKKYKLGKSKNKRQVGILIKDSQTRKNVVNSQKELKRTPLKDCKKYLQTHNLIKIGGGAPNDVIRATYESAMMAGEITNLNKDTLLNNMMKEDNT